MFIATDPAGGSGDQASKHRPLYQGKAPNKMLCRLPPEIVILGSVEWNLVRPPPIQHSTQVSTVHNRFR